MDPLKSCSNSAWSAFAAFGLRSHILVYTPRSVLHRTPPPSRRMLNLPAYRTILRNGSLSPLARKSQLADRKCWQTSMSKALHQER